MKANGACECEGCGYKRSHIHRHTQSVGASVHINIAMPAMVHIYTAIPPSVYARVHIYCTQPSPVLLHGFTYTQTAPV